MMPFPYRNTNKKKSKKEIEKQQQHNTNYDNKYWKWPSCKQYPKTQSFRGGAACGITDDDDVIFKTVNSVFLSEHDHQIKHDQSQTSTANLVKPATNWFTTTANSSSCDDTNTTLVHSDKYRLQQEECDDDLQDMILARGVKSDRLFFDPAASASGAKLLLVLQEKNEEVKDAIQEICSVNNVDVLTNNSVNTVVMESEDPYGDFRNSMEEMMNCNEDDDHNNWEYLEELLYLYLRLNGKKNHGYIIKALVDLVTDISSKSGSSHSVVSSSSSALVDSVTNISSSSTGSSHSSDVSSSSSAYSSAVSSFHSRSGMCSSSSNEHR